MDDVHPLGFCSFASQSHLLYICTEIMVEKTRPRSLSRPRISLKPRPSANKSSPDVMKLLHVSVTVVGLSGVYFKESTKAKNTDTSLASGVKVYPKTTVVASFTRNGDQEASVDDHLRSIPLDLTKPTTKDAAKEAVTWPTESIDKSTFQFERYFLREKSKGRKSKKKAQNLYAPQSCRVQLAVCRNRRWFKLGDADIVINGEEKELNVTVPLINHDTPKSKKSKGNVIPMARLKGETLKCGLGNNAALRVVVNVSESPNVEKIMHPNLATVVSWEYDPTKAAVVKKSKSKESIGNVKQPKGYLLAEKAANGTQEKTEEKQNDKKSEKNLETIASSALATLFSVASQEQSEIVKSPSKGGDSLSPLRLNSSPSKVDSLPPIRQTSTSSRPENILDRIMSVTNDPPSPQASTATPSHRSTSTPPLIPVPTRTGFSPIRVSSPMRNLSPFRSLSPLRQNSEGSSHHRASVLDRVVTITSEGPPPPEKTTLSQHLASSPARRTKGIDQGTIYFIEHDMKPSDESTSSPHTSLDPPAAEDLKKAHTRSSITMSTERSSHMSPSEYSQSRNGDASFTPSHNSAFTPATSLSSSKNSTDRSSDSRGDNDDMANIMAELLEKTPSELYAIIHDLDPKEARRLKKENKGSKRHKSRKVIEEEESVESESDDSYTTDYESVSESSFFYESIGGSSVCSSNSESYISFIDSRQRKSKQNTFAEKIFSKRFMCNFPMCGIGKGSDDRTLSYVDDKVTHVNGKQYIMGCRDGSNDTSTFTGHSSSSGKATLLSSEIDFY